MSRQRNGAIAWMARNPVASNLLMLLLIGGGIATALDVKQEVFPEFERDEVRVSIAYPGASPEEIEQGILLVVEEGVRGINGVKKVVSAASEGSGIIRVQLLNGTDLDKALSDVKGAVDRIRSFPLEAERPVIKLAQWKQRAISVMVHGQHEHETLRRYAEELRGRIVKDTVVTQSDIVRAPLREIAIEIPSERLRAYNLTVESVANAIKRASIDLPSGRIRSVSGELLIRTTERRNLGTEFEDIVIFARSDGTQIRVGDIANVRDGFAETDYETSFNGEPVVQLNIYRVGKQTPTEISEAIRRFVAEQAPPPGMGLSIWRDQSIMFSERIDLLKRNALQGLILVFIVLGLFLEIRLAFWVMLGIPISFIGAFLFLPLFDASINMVSMFAFLTVLGIVVDDAIVVGENIFEKRRQGMKPIEAAIEGALQVSSPVFFAVATTIVAFGPLLLVPGFIGKIFGVIPVVVMATLALSIVECLFILPAHLAHSKQAESGFTGWLTKKQMRVSQGLDRLIDGLYVPLVRWATDSRYLTTALALGSLIICGGIIAGGLIKFSFFPKLEGDYVSATVRLPVDSTMDEVRAIEDLLVRSAKAIAVELDGNDALKGISSNSGRLNSNRRGQTSATPTAEVAMMLVPMSQRENSSRDYSKAWRKAVGPIPGAESLQFKFSLRHGGGDAIDIQLSHQDSAVLEQAASKVARKLETYEGLKDIDAGFSNGKDQLDARLTDIGRATGLTERGLARQLRGAFFGQEVLRQQRGRDELKVMVRLPRTERDQRQTLEDLMLNTPSGGEVPFSMAASTQTGKAYNDIRRVSGQRVINITADVASRGTNANEIVRNIKKEYLPILVEETPGLTFSLEGQSREQSDSLSSLRLNFLFALLIIYALLAVPFRSYAQPLLVMSAIPFGLVGALGGHLLMGYDLSIISGMGMVALSGVVVNDSLLLIVATNEYRQSGLSAFEAVVAGGRRRFRPILLTSLTTFFGLLPIMFETSVQARFLIPMTLSLGFGVLWATVIVLFFVPSFYLILEDTKSLASRLFGAPPENVEFDPELSA